MKAKTEEIFDYFRSFIIPVYYFLLSFKTSGENERLLMPAPAL
jgi:hypothetical protein